MRLIFIRTVRLKKTYLLGLITASVLLLLGLNSVFASNRTLPATSWVVANRVIVIDPGHGGIDPGAVSDRGVQEKDIVLQVAKRLQKLLNQAGARVIMTRKSDTDLSDPGSGSLSHRKREDLGRRVKLANDSRADIYLSIHVNSFPSSYWRGAQTFYQGEHGESKKLAEAIQAEMIRILGNTDRAAKAGDFYTTRNTRMVSVIVEIGFISNHDEAELVTQPAYQRKLAYAIYSGLIRYYRENPVPNKR